MVYGCLVSLLRDIPHFSSEQLMSLLDENQLQSSIQSQFGTSKHQRESMMIGFDVMISFGRLLKSIQEMEKDQY